MKSDQSSYTSASTNTAATADAAAAASTAAAAAAAITAAICYQGRPPITLVILFYRKMVLIYFFEY